ncbi:hypothetical protein N0V88_002044 [Collariella sp. IMI 366227]|nr:hypothetical protein N0V88_002044 [Collariella sp. IMI 366227]
MLAFEFGVQNLPGGAASGFGSRDLGRLGPLYHATQYPSRSMPGQGDFAFPPTVFPTTSQPAFPASATYPALQPGTSSLDVGWQTANGGLYGSDSSPAVSTGSNASVYGYASQGNTPNPYVGDYVSPTALQNAPPASFDVYPGWPGPGDGTVSLGTPNPGALPSPGLQNYEGMVGTPDAAFSDSDQAMYGDTDTWQQQQQPSLHVHTTALSSPRHHKRAKKSIDDQSTTSSSIASSSMTHHHNHHQRSLPLPPQSTTTTAAAANKTKLRSASRASKNMQFRPQETPQERKSRNSHNLVEKQYRNRLNMQFEILMNTLPESMRSPSPTTTTNNTTANGASGETLTAAAGVVQERLGSVWWCGCGTARGV